MRHAGATCPSQPTAKAASLCGARLSFLCTRIASMDKEEVKERIRVPFLGFAAVLMSIAAFLLGLYIVTVAIRFVFALGQLGQA